MAIDRTYYWIAVGWMLLASACAEAAELVLVDSSKAETQSVVLARLSKEAQAAQSKKTGKTEALTPPYQEALEQSQSAWRQALPEVVAQVAKSKKADIVVEPALAKQYGIQAIEVTAEVVKILDQRFASAKFIAP